MTISRRVYACLVSFVLAALFPCGFAAVAMADSQISIGVIQYNAKGGMGGWKTGGEALEAQKSLLMDKINDPKNPSPVQFITLVQASAPVVSETLKLQGWNTVKGGCKGPGGKYFEGTQIAYSGDWELVDDSNITNPLADDFKSSYCWSPGRPYNIAYFSNKKNGLKLLYLVVHFPHCGGYDGDLAALRKCLADWPGLKALDENVMRVTGVALDKLSAVNVVISGDTNELGDAGAGSAAPFPAKADGYELIFSHFGKLVVSTLDRPSCCDNNGWSSYFDRIVTNNVADKPYAAIIEPASGHYPLFAQGGPDEEHKAIYGVITFPLGAQSASQPSSDAK